MSTTPLSIMNDTTTEATISNATASTTNVTQMTDPGCDDQSGVTCSTSQGFADPLLCARLAPPPVPPWLEDSPSRLHELTRHCRSWTLYHELCQTGAGNSTAREPRHDVTSEGDVLVSGPNGIQWVIPALAMVVVLLLMILAAVMYKYYSRSNKRRMYRVAGSGRPFKLPQTTSSWAGSSLVESETMESYLCQPEGGVDMRYTRSPVCRLLEQIQFVATPTEAQLRPRQSGPPAFSSPAYFLPALSWLRLPMLQNAWPGENSGSGQGQTTRYDAGQRVCSNNGEVTHQWPAGVDNGLEDDMADNEPEYSEIWDGNPFQGPPHYSSLSHAPYNLANETAVCNCPSSETANGNAHYEMDYMQHHFPDLHRGQHVFRPNEHRYEKLWPCGEACDGNLPHAPASPSTPGTCENGWLSKYRLPSPCLNTPDHAHRRERGAGPEHVHWAGAGADVDELTSDCELLPVYSVRRPPGAVPEGRSAVTEGGSARAGERIEVKYRNPLFEGHGALAPTPSNHAPSFSRLWGFLGWNKR